MPSKSSRTAKWRASGWPPDLHLPEVSGTDLLMEIRADERLTKTRVIVATGDPYLANNLRPMADLVLIKPVGYVQLRDLAKHLLEADSLA